MERPTITYVRHAMPVVDEDVPSDEWHLAEPTIDELHEWSERLELTEGGALLVTSTEPKAFETAAAIAERWGLEVVSDDRLREANRPWVGTGYRALAHRYLRGEQPDGWEPHEAVAERVGAAVRDAEGKASGGSVLIVSHGLALSLHLGDRLGPDFDSESFWSRLAFPDAWALDADDVLHRSLPTSID